MPPQVRLGTGYYGRLVTSLFWNAPQYFLTHMFKMRSNIWSRPSPQTYTRGTTICFRHCKLCHSGRGSCIQRIIERQLQNLTKADDSRNQDGIHADYTDEIKEGKADTAGENTGQQSPDQTTSKSYTKNLCTI